MLDSGTGDLLTFNPVVGGWLQFLWCLESAENALAVFYFWVGKIFAELTYAVNPDYTGVCPNSGDSSIGDYIFDAGLKLGGNSMPS
jgi:hypothetical protein